jgi:hypothetical protein
MEASMANMGDYAVACGGDMYAGNLLYRMMYLHNKTNRIKDGVKWYVRSSTDLARESALTEWKYKKALAHLQKLGFVKTTTAAQVGVFNMGLTTTAFCVTDTARAAVFQAKGIKNLPPRSEGDRSSRSEDDRSSKSEDDLPTYISKKGKKEGKKTNDLTRSKADEKESEPFLDKKEVFQGEGEYGKCEKESKQENPPIPVAPPLKKSLTSYVLEKVYREAFKKFDPAYIHVTWSAPKRGIAKVFMKQVGEKRVENVLGQCVSKWSAFREFAQSGTSLHVPKEPNLLSLSTHAAAAVTFCEHSADDCTPKKSNWAMKTVLSDFE